MGHQSFVLPFKTEAELERIKQVIVMHNDLGGQSPAGEVLDGFCVAKHRSENEFAILCHHGGGRRSTFAFFAERGVLAKDYGDEQDSYPAIFPAFSLATITFRAFRNSEIDPTALGPTCPHLKKLWGR